MKFASLQEAWGADVFNDTRSSPSWPPARQSFPSSEASSRRQALPSMQGVRGGYPQEPSPVMPARNYFTPPLPAVMPAGQDELKYQLMMLYDTQGLQGVLKVIPQQVINTFRNPQSSWIGTDILPRLGLDGHTLTSVVVLCFVFVILWDVFTRTFRR